MHGLVPWRFTFVATKYVRRVLRMPRPCAVEVHVRRYKIRQKGFADATALRRGGSRLSLQNTSEGFCGCHGLAPWGFTFAAAQLVDRASNVKLHGTRPWHLRESCGFSLAASVSLHGTRPWHLRESCGFSLAASVSLHGARPRHPNSVAPSLGSEWVNLGWYSSIVLTSP